jgi:hypothetical protein
MDQYLDPNLGVVPYAEATARAAAELLEKAHRTKKNQYLLCGPHATLAAIESRIRKLKKNMKSGDTLLVWIIARGFRHKGKGLLAAWDTLADDLIDTSLSIADLVRDLGASKASEVVFLLDVGLGPKLIGVQPSTVEPHLDFDELRDLFSRSPNAVCLSATGAEEESLPATALQSGAWGYLVREALAGRSAKALTPEGTITAQSLQAYIEDEWPRVMRKHFVGRVHQTPQLFGEQNTSAVVAELSALVRNRSQAQLLDAMKLRRLVFGTESTGRVKELTGFRKSFRLPEHAGPSARQFITKCAAPDVRADLDTVFELVRERLGYKRKEIDTAVGSDGSGTLSTPDFVYTVSATLDPSEPSQVIWRREIGQLCDIDFVKSSGFESVFGRTFDQLMFEFAENVDVGELVDRLEDHLPDGVRVSVESDGRACVITLDGFAGSVRVERSRLTVRGRTGHTTGLLDQFLTFIERVGPIGEPLALPPKR